MITKLIKAAINITTKLILMEMITPLMLPCQAKVNFFQKKNGKLTNFIDNISDDNMEDFERQKPRGCFAAFCARLSGGKRK